MLRSWLLVVFSLCLLGCTSFGTEPLYITFPQVPHLTYRLCDVPGQAQPDVCLSQTDAAALAKWLDKVRAFEAARQRLLER